MNASQPAHRPFLVAVCRPDGILARDELASMKAIGGLDDRDLHALPLVDEASPHPVSDIDLDQYSGVIITGSPFGFEHPHEKKTDEHLRVEERIDALAAVLLKRDFPTFGICFGIQSLARASGAPLVQGFSEDLQAPEITLTEAGRVDPLTGALPPSFYAYTGHTDAIGAIPAGAELLATGSRCHVQILRWGHNIYGTQFHPEITREGMHLRIDTYGDTYYPAEEKPAVIARCDAADTQPAHDFLASFIHRYKRA